MHRRRLFLLAGLALAACVTPDVVPPDVARDLAPSGTLHAAINYGNPVLAQRDAASGELRGVSVDLARELARRAGVPVELRPYDAAGKVTADATSGRWGKHPLCARGMGEGRGAGGHTTHDV